MGYLKAVIFDSDGTLLNSFELILAAYRHVAETHHLRAPTADEVRAQLGNTLPVMLQTFYPDQDITPLLATNSAYVATHTMSSETFDHVHETLGALYRHGLKMAILTGGNHKVVDLLEYHHIAHYFTSIVHCERITKPKPDSEGFLMAARECGVQVGEAIMVGDTPTDVLTGKRAGAFATIGITHGYSSLNALRDAEPDYLLESLKAVKRTILALAS